MNFLYSRNNRKFHTVLSGSKCPDFFTSTDPTQLTKVTYTSAAVLQADEWFEVDLNTLPNVSDPLEKLNRQVNNSLPTISRIQYKDILYIVFKKSNEDYFYLQKILPSAKVYGKQLVSFSSQPDLIEQPIVIVAEVPDAIYEISTKKLIFKKLDFLESIFTGLNTLFRTATTAEVTQFFQLGGLLAIDPLYTVDKVGIPNRKNIAKALDIYNSYTPQIQQSLHAYIQTLGLPADANGKYIITDEQSLKNFAYAIQERFYTTQASMQDRLAQAYVPV